MKRTNRYNFKNGRIYKIGNKRLSQKYIFKILNDDIKEKGNSIVIKLVKLYLKIYYDKYHDIEESETDLVIFDDDIIYEISEQELFLEIL